MSIKFYIQTHMCICVCVRVKQSQKLVEFDDENANK